MSRVGQTTAGRGKGTRGRALAAQSSPASARAVCEGGNDRLFSDGRKAAVTSTVRSVERPATGSLASCVRRVPRLQGRERWSTPFGEKLAVIEPPPVVGAQRNVRPPRSSRFDAKGRCWAGGPARELRGEFRRLNSDRLRQGHTVRMINSAEAVLRASWVANPKTSRTSFGLGLRSVQARACAHVRRPGTAGRPRRSDGSVAWTGLSFSRQQISRGHLKRSRALLPHGASVSTSVE